MAKDINNNIPLGAPFHATNEKGMAAHADEVYLDGYNENTASGDVTNTDNVESAIKKLSSKSATHDTAIADAKKAGTDAASLAATNKTTVDNYTINGKKVSTNPVIDKEDVGLDNVDNTSDLDKPVSTATQTALDKKQNTLGNSEDIIIKDGKTYFADKDADAANFQSRGKVYLRKNIVNGKNVLTQDMISQKNSTYYVDYDITVQGALTFNTLTIVGNGQTFDFQGNWCRGIHLVNFHVLNYYTNKNSNYEDTPSGTWGMGNKFDNCTFENITSTYQIGFMDNQVIYAKDYFDNTTDIINSSYVDLSKLLDKIDKAIENNRKRRYTKIYFDGIKRGYISKPYTIKNNVSYDFSKVEIVCTADFDVSSGYVFNFERNDKGITNIVNGSIKNISQINASAVTGNLFTILDISDFNSTMENIFFINPSKTTKYAIYQKRGTPYVRYSDKKVLRRIQVNASISDNTYKTVLGSGDGNLIDRCFLGGCAFMGGHSYNVRGCLNDHYLLYGTEVNFSGSYFEKGNFLLYHSYAYFDNMKLQSTSNNSYLANNFVKRIANNPMFALDTDTVKNIIAPLIKERIAEQLEVNPNPTVQLYKTEARTEIPHSKVYFGSNILFYLEYWNYLSGYANNIIEKDDYSEIIGLENLLSKNQEFVHYVTNGDRLIINNKEFNKDTVDSSIDINNIGINFGTINDDDTSNIPTDTSLYPYLGIDYTDEEINKEKEFSVYIVLSLNRCLINKLSTKDISFEVGRYNSYTINFSNKFDNIHFISVLKVGENIYYKYSDVKYNFIEDDYDKDTGTFTKLTKVPIKYYDFIIKNNYTSGYKGNYSNYFSVNTDNDYLSSSKFNVCTKVDILDKTHVRAYLSKLPEFGTWQINDECVVGTTIYRYNGFKWIEDSTTV